MALVMTGFELLRVASQHVDNAIEVHRDNFPKALADLVSKYKETSDQCWVVGGVLLDWVSASQTSNTNAKTVLKRLTQDDLTEVFMRKQLSLLEEIGGKGVVLDPKPLQTLVNTYDALFNEALDLEKVYKSHRFWGTLQLGTSVLGLVMSISMGFWGAIGGAALVLPPALQTLTTERSLSTACVAVTGMSLTSLGFLVATGFGGFLFGGSIYLLTVLIANIHQDLTVATAMRKMAEEGTQSVKQMGLITTGVMESLKRCLKIVYENEVARNEAGDFLRTAANNALKDLEDVDKMLSQLESATKRFRANSLDAAARSARYMLYAERALKRG